MIENQTVEQAVEKAAEKAPGEYLHPLPTAVDGSALLALAVDHHARAVRSVGVREVAGHLVKLYVIEAPERTLAERELEPIVAIAGGQLAGAAARGSLGLGVLIVHAGGDGDYVLVHSWIEGYMSDLAIFTGPAGQPDQLRPGRAGLAPCVWEAAVLAHEREAFVRRVLDGAGPVAERLAAWAADVLTGEVR
ncbi:hypothetical protein OG500_10105 [Kitasatospora sp. NBC_01250]|uniref:hypothetical protein n=1 Tax=Kitasatospora sp. NBC_01250 TaxID=2903571 RepID=UPI002E3757B0|nr:hypothetical protein [Kitasatospora sp. NBC_01250]